ncbi:hypothetical protein GCM10027169_29750 [Gordonia jinhuaensis]|uniref:DUF1275 domain-containing protein n=2 Tax=Gordonia jinhuaensis TaxID=1517702 RepID=A0A916T5Q2_9ACTN|nr:hypothetical protein GCM10011489_21110 [Gordonia jinhuaensis]
MTWNATDLNDKHPALGPFYDVREMVLAATLAALAGATGAAAWLYTSGWYVTFMTGNSERLVLEHFKGQHVMALSALATVAVFTAGVIAASLARLRLWRKARHGATLMTMGAAILAWLCDVILVDEGHAIGAIPVLCLAFGLGALNTSISRRGEVVMPLSYMTGTLVKIGQGVAMHAAKVKRWAWLPHLTTYAGFLLGAGIGGTIFTALDTHSSLLALAGFASLVAVGTWKLDHPRFITQDVH